MRLLSKLWLLLYLALLAQGQLLAQSTLVEGKSESVGMSRERLERLDRLMQEYVDQGKLAGVAVLVARNGKIVHYKAYGYENLETKTPLRHDAIFRIASQTKPIACIAALTLYEEGELLLDDPVSKYIPEFRTMRVLGQFNEKDSSFTTVPAKREIIIRDLFTHTGGIACSEEVSAIKMKNKLTTESRTLGEFTKALVELPIAYQPGEKWEYSGCMDVLAYVCEIISGQSFDQFLQTRLFGPLGMMIPIFTYQQGKQVACLQFIRKMRRVSYKG
jgi:CubicO group peptidase (beta-lactamase class C family)